MMKIKKLKWEYIYNPQTQNLKDRFQIIPQKKKKKEQPKALYKYYPLNEFSVDAFNKYLYASCPLDLNDPLDCMGSLINICKVDFKEEYENYRKIETAKRAKIGSYKEFKQGQIDGANGYLGIVSLTENEDDLNMWAHYASNHKGFVVRFNTNLLKQKTELIGPFQINYRKKWKSFDLKDKKKAPLAFLFQTNVKSKKWKHENEWRFIGTRKEMYMPRVFTEQKHIDNRKFEYAKECIEEIIIGMNFWIGILKVEPSDLLWKIVFEVKEGINFHKYQILKFLSDQNMKVSTFESKVKLDFTLQKIPIKVKKISDLEFQIEKISDN